jgi:hypothetical protein
MSFISKHYTTFSDEYEKVTWYGCTDERLQTQLLAVVLIFVLKMRGWHKGSVYVYQD